jgi:hypothetical protein
LIVPDAIEPAIPSRFSAYLKKQLLYLRCLGSGPAVSVLPNSRIGVIGRGHGVNVSCGERGPKFPDWRRAFLNCRTAFKVSRQ